MSAFFSTPERIANLESVAQSWVGTPFYPHGTTKGRGCSCQTLVTEVYKECGFLPSDFNTPRYSLHRFRATGISQIREFVDAMPQMATVALPDLLPGDMVLFLNKDMEHSGIVLPGEHIAHSMFRVGVQIDHWKEATFVNFLAAAWRPIIL